MRKKKDLMGLILPKLSESQIRTAKNDKYIKREFTYSWALWPDGAKTYTETSYGTRMYYAARTQAGILVVSAWTRSRASKQEAPDYTCYIDAENAKWWTVCADGKWSGSMLDTIENKIYITNTNHRAKDIDDQESLDLCRSALGVEDRADIPGTVLKWQNEQKEKANRERAQKKREYCDARMATIPEIPEGFTEWADREGTQEDHFIFYRGKRKAYCTRCGALFVPDRKLTHSPGNPGEWNYESEACICYCPECRAKLTAKSWNMQKTVLTYGSAVLVQQVESEVVFRHFVVKKVFYPADELDMVRGKVGWRHSISLQEGMRVFADPETFKGKESYWLGEVNNMGFTGWKRTRRRVLHGIKETLEARDMPAGRAYIEDPDGLARLTGIRRCIIDRCTRFDRTYNAQLMLIRVAGKRYLEYLFRSGLKRLANQIISGWHTNDLNEDAKDLKTLLGLDGVQLERLKAMDGDMNTLQVIRQAGAMGEKIDDDTLRVLSQNGINPESLLLKETGMSLQKMVNYLRKQADAKGRSLKSTKMIYGDYIDAARKLGIDTTDDIVRRPRSLEEMHDRYVEEVKEREGAQRDASVNGKFPHISENAGENVKHFGYKKEGLVIIVPKAASDITKEGREQHHCVGASDNYIGKMDRGETYILFVRREDDLGTPYYTLEVKYDGKIIQARSKFNRQPDWKIISAFLESFTREIKKRTEREEKKARRAERGTEEGKAAELICCAV